MARMIEIPDYAEIDVRRPDGTMETVRRPGSRLTDRDFGKLRDATAAAGRGTLLAYRNVSKSVPMIEPTAGERAEEHYYRATNAIIVAGAGGEPHDRVGADRDRTPAHKDDH